MCGYAWTTRLTDPVEKNPYSLWEDPSSGRGCGRVILVKFISLLWAFSPASPPNQTTGLVLSSCDILGFSGLSFPHGDGGIYPFPAGLTGNSVVLMGGWGRLVQKSRAAICELKEDYSGCTSLNSTLHCHVSNPFFLNTARSAIHPAALTHVPERRALRTDWPGDY